MSNFIHLSSRLNDNKLIIFVIFLSNISDMSPPAIYDWDDLKQYYKESKLVKYLEEWLTSNDQNRLRVCMESYDEGVYFDVMIYLNGKSSYEASYSQPWYKLKVDLAKNLDLFWEKEKDKIKKSIC